MSMSDEERAYMERQVDFAMSGYPEYEKPGDRHNEPEGALLEKFPHQEELKEYLIKNEYIEFRGTTKLGTKTFRVLGARGNIAWCCDPECDKIIVDMPLSLFLDEGRGGEIAQHEDCFMRNLNAGHYRLPRDGA